MILRPSNIEPITGKKSYYAQARELIALGIRHQRRRDGSVLVLIRVALNAWTDQNR
jgi:hypothetical protein